MKDDNVAAVRNAYAVAERKDLEGWISLFTPDGVFTDNSVGATYRGRGLADPVRNYGTAFSNMHRELYRIYADGDVVEIENGKIKRFDCYPEGSVIFAQLGVLNNLDAALRH